MSSEFVVLCSKVEVVPLSVCGEKELAHEAPCGDDGCMRAYVGAMSRPILSHDPSLEKTSMHSATASV